MPRILIANIDNENMMADERAFTRAFCLSSSITASRMAWFAEPGDIVVLPRDMSPAFTRYLARMRGHVPGSIIYVTPDWNGAPFRPLGSRELLRLGLPERLSELMRGRREWSLLPYCYERGAQLLSEALGIDGRHGAKPFMRQGGAELLNDKRVFRSLAAGRGVPIALGTVCGDAASLEAAIQSLIDHTSAVIVKQDRHSGGMGNLIVSRSGDIRGLGAREVVALSNEVTIADAARMAWERLAYQTHAPLVVEAYYAVAAVVTAEFAIDPAANSVTFLNCGEVRQAPILSGIIMPWSLGAYQAAGFIAAATEIARLCCDLGYEGLINIDGMVTADGRMMVNEFNGRIGGCSHIHQILSSVAGPGYGERLVVTSHSRNTALGIDRVIDDLGRHHLDFNAESGRGIVLTGEDCAGSGYIEYLSIAPTREEAMHVEAAFEGLLDGRDIDAQVADSRRGIEHLAKILSHLPGVGVPGSGAAEKHEPALRQGTTHQP